MPKQRAPCETFVGNTWGLVHTVVGKNHQLLDSFLQVKTLSNFTSTDLTLYLSGLQPTVQLTSSVR